MEKNIEKYLKYKSKYLKAKRKGGAAVLGNQLVRPTNPTLADINELKNILVGNTNEQDILFNIGAIFKKIQDVTGLRYMYDRGTNDDEVYTLLKETDEELGELYISKKVTFEKIIKNKVDEFKDKLREKELWSDNATSVKEFFENTNFNEKLNKLSFEELRVLASLCEEPLVRIGLVEEIVEKIYDKIKYVISKIKVLELRDTILKTINAKEYTEEDTKKIEELYDKLINLRRFMIAIDLRRNLLLTMLDNISTVFGEKREDEMSIQLLDKFYEAFILDLDHVVM